MRDSFTTLLSIPLYKVKMSLMLCEGVKNILKYVFMLLASYYPDPEINLLVGFARYDVTAFRECVKDFVTTVCKS